MVKSMIRNLMAVKIANAKFVGKFSARLGYLVIVTRMLIIDGNYGKRRCRGGVEWADHRRVNRRRLPSRHIATVYAGNKILTLAGNGSWVGWRAWGWSKREAETWENGGENCERSRVDEPRDIILFSSKIFFRSKSHSPPFIDRVNLRCCI